MTRFAFDAFVSYAHADVEFTRKLVDRLREAGFRVWLDEEEMPAGERFRDIIQKGIRTSRHLIAVLTAEYAARRWTQREVDLFDLPASQQRRRVLAVTLDEIEDRKLDQVFLVHQRIRWREGTFDPEAFWLLYCGLSDRKPGPHKFWASEGKRLVRRRVVKPSMRAPQHPATEMIVEPQVIARAAPAPAEAPATPRAAPKRSLHDAPRAWEWASVGPTNIGGRATSLVCHPTRPDQVWLGTAGGGVWKSEDAGRSWRPLWHKQETLAVGSLAIDPANSDILYCGTGEANMALDCAAGAGVFRTDDGGLTWRLLAPAAEHGLPLHIGALAVDPFDSRHIRLAGVRLWGASPGPAGLFSSHDAGANWDRDKRIAPADAHVHTVLFHPSRAGVIFAALEGARGGGVWRSTNGGRNWIHLRAGLPTSKTFGRASLAVATSNPDVIYAVVADPQGRVLGVFRSEDMGARWTTVAASPFPNEMQAFYNNAIAIHPHDHRRVLWGGRDMFSSHDGGSTWQQATDWRAGRGAPRFANASHHVLVAPAAAPDRVYDANDGGLDVSEDGGATWCNRSRGLSITMFNRIAVASADSRYFGGGASSFGAVVTTTGRPDDHVEVLGESGGWLSGGWMAFHPEQPQEMYVSHQASGLYHIEKGGLTRISPPLPPGETLWLAAMAMNPGNPRVLFTGSRRVWCTMDGGKRWIAVSPLLDVTRFGVGAVSAIEVAPGDVARVYAATTHGGVFRSMDRGRSWSKDLGANVLPRAWVSSMKSRPTNPDEVFIALGGAGSHVFRSHDGGLTWIDIDKGRLPLASCTAIALPRADPTCVYVAGDGGVFVSPNGGDTWQSLTGNLPNTVINDIVYHEGDGALYVGTYGRSIWRLQVL
jgi:photosystem II stability/assembly factor-like uncharacterized protein